MRSLSTRHVLFVCALAAVFAGCAAGRGPIEQLHSKQEAIVGAPCLGDGECDGGEFCDLRVCIPEGPCAPGGVCRTQTRFYDNDVTDIPDNDPAGAEGAINVERPAATVASLHVSGFIRHTYRGDLLLILRSPTGVEHVLHDRTGGSADDLSFNVDVSETYAGHPAPGLWTLSVSDHAARDIGQIATWSLDFGFAPPRVDPPNPTSDIWATVELLSSQSAHPYENDTDETLDLRRFSGGAARSRIHFARIEVERGYDVVEVVDLESGDVLDSFTGTLEAFVTQEYNTGELGVRLVSDYSVTAWGYQLSAIEVFGKGCLSDAECPDGTQCPNELVRCIAWPCFLSCRPIYAGAEGEACDTSDNCADELYCGSDHTCRAGGSCSEVSDCNDPDNAWIHILCAGGPTCEADTCGWDCGPPAVCADGETSDDGCNTCVCRSGLWMCTERYCPPVASAGETCGGETLCDEGLVCDRGETDGPTCSSEQAGICVAEPEAPRFCRSVYAPLCTCTGQTFDGPCQRQGMAAWAHDGECMIDVAIPDADPAGIQTIVHVEQPASSRRALVEVRIDHSWRGDLTVTVEAPDGSRHILTERAGGSADGFDYSSIIELEDANVVGAWTFHVSDHASYDTGVLRHVNVRAR